MDPYAKYTPMLLVYGVDPRLYPDASKLTEIQYEEMKEMAFLGANVMEPRSVDIAQNYGVIVYVTSLKKSFRRNIH